MDEMQSKSDAQLLREYAEHGTEAAFTEIVARYTNLVYSAAVRQTDSPDMAAEITQNVLIGLARGARGLSPRLAEDASLAGWLCRSTRNTSLNLRRNEFRRHSRERQAMEHLNPIPETPPEWERLRPVLDEIMSELSDPDYDALVMRFFNNQDLRSVGRALGVSDDTAQKRVSRALDRLRQHLSRRGISTPAAALSIVLSANAVQTAPAGLAMTILTAVTGAETTIGTIVTATATKALVMTTLQKTLIAAALVVAVGTGIYEVRQASNLRTQLQHLQQQQAPLVEQITQFKSDIQSRSNAVAQTSLSSERLRELLRLRGEVALLRRQQRELESAIAAAQSKAPGIAGKAASELTLNPNKPAPFQVQLVLDEPGGNTEPMTNNVGGVGEETLHVQKSPLMDYMALSSATVTSNASSGAPEINLEFSAVGKELLAAITKENINKRLALVLDGQLYSAPMIRSEISGGKAQITGAFTETEARALVAKINDAISAK